MNFLGKNMFWTYTILAVLCGIFALVFGALATYADRKESSSPTTTSNTYNISGDYVKRDKKVTEKSKIERNNHRANSVDEKPKTKQIINNGIINSGANYGTQTVNNNYNELQPRRLNNDDIKDIKNKIPLDYNVIINFVNSTEESINYAQEILTEVKRLGYNIIEINSIGMYVEGGGIPQPKDEKYRLDIDNSNKKVIILIRTQK